jgi:hypothetical protein
MSPEIESLIERLAALSAPDREVDARIVLALNLRPNWARNDKAELVAKRSPLVAPEDWIVSLGLDGPSIGTPPRFTESIDAALTLVPIDPAPTREPKPLPWKLGYSRHVPCVAEIKTARGVVLGECDSNHAIALCIAALRARAQAEEEGK